MLYLVLPFWYRITWVVPEKGPLNGCVCVCVLSYLLVVTIFHTALPIISGFGVSTDSAP